MDPIRRILVRIQNPSAPSLPAVTKAAQLARVLGAELTLFQSLAAPFSPDDELPARHLLPGSLQNYSRSAHEACLKGIALGLRRHGIRVSLALRWSRPGEQAILDEANVLNSDLLVLDTLPHRTGDHVLSPHDREIVRRSPVPLLLVKRLAPYRRPRILLALDRERATGATRLLDARVMRLGSRLCAALHGSLHAVSAYTTQARVRPYDGPLSAALLTLAASTGSRRGQPEGSSAGNAAHFAGDIRSALVVMGASVEQLDPSPLVCGESRLIEHLACDILLIKPRLRAIRTHPRPDSAAARPLSRRRTPGGSDAGQPPRGTANGLD